MTNTVNFPVKIDKFEFFNNSFTIKGKKYDYGHIESLRFVVQNVSINFSKDETYNLSIRMNDDTIHEIYARDASFSINKKKAVVKKSNTKAIYNYLNQGTYSRRVEIYLNQLKNNKFIIYKFVDQHKLLGSKLKTVKICADGNVILDNTIYNLEKARQTGTLKFGTAYGLGCDRTIDPYEISINEKKPILGGRAEGLGSMRIDGSWDYPIVFEILKSLSGISS